MNLNGYSVDTVRRHNLKLIMHCLYEKRLSCKELANIIGLSETAIKKNIIQLLDNKMVVACEEDDDEKKTVGRQHIRYEVNKKFGHFLLIDFTYRNEEFYITDICGNVKVHEKCSLSSQITTDEFDGIIEKILGVVNTNHYKIKEIAVSVAGQVDEESGEINFSSRFDKYNIKNIKEIMLDYFPNTEIFVKNDLRYLVYGDPLIVERSTNTIASYFTVGYGIMSSFVKNGTIIQGINGIAGEIGGINRLDGQCIHMSCSISELTKKASLIEKCNNFDELLKLYKTNEKIHELVLDSARYLAYDIDSITCALGSSNIVLVGEITKFGEEYRLEIQKCLNKMTYFDRKVEFIDSSGYRKNGMINKLKDHIVRCIKN